MSDAIIRRRVTVGGRVQGVGFRAACVEEARRRGVAGWVRNLPGGDVEILAEGEPGAVTALIDWARQGPDYARVTSVSVAVEPAGSAAGFEVRWD